MITKPYVAAKVPELLTIENGIGVRGIKECTSPNAFSCKRVTVDSNVLRAFDSLSVLGLAILMKDIVMEVNEHKDLFEFNVKICRTIRS